MKERIIRILLLAASIWACANAGAAEVIEGSARVSAQALTGFVQQHNPEFDPAIAEAFIAMGERYGLRGDVALCQAVLETGWFRYEGGTAVTPDQHNYCGMGVTSLGVKGCTFESVEEGVEAMMQHLLAYATRRPLPTESRLLDPRFSLVSRGSAPTWEELSGRWAMNPDYGRHILELYSQLLVHAGFAPLAEEQEQAGTEAVDVSIPEIF